MIRLFLFIYYYIEKIDDMIIDWVEVLVLYVVIGNECRERNGEKVYVGGGMVENG